MISGYFESIVNGENPYRYKFGAALCTYSIRSDTKIAGLGQQDLSIHVKKSAMKNFFPVQCKTKKIGKEEQLVNVGYREFDSSPLGVVVGRGDELEDAVKMIYDTVKGISCKGLYYRPIFDYLSTDYVSSIPNRIKFLQKKRLID